jgi:hypothetical protein
MGALNNTIFVWLNMLLQAEISQYINLVAESKWIQAQDAKKCSLVFRPNLFAWCRKMIGQARWMCRV